ncbi:hypothetical protein ACFL12_02400 [Pseudomonadota bacterium]
MIVRGGKTALSALILGLTGLGLAACASDTPAKPLPCPQILIAENSENRTNFKPGAGRDIIDVLDETKITGFSSACKYDVDETGTGTVAIQLAPDFVIQRGPASTTDSAQFEYFIAVTDSQRRVLEKKRYPVSIPFPQGVPSILWKSDPPTRLALPLSQGQNGDNYVIFLGLQLNREQLRHNQDSR